ncbi:MAG: TolC family protein [Desulfobacterales bacterium]
MIFYKVHHRLLTKLSLCALVLGSVSCTLVTEQIDGAAGVPADSAVSVAAENADLSLGADKVPSAAAGPLKVTLGEAILLCLENNRSLVIERLNPSIRQTYEAQERALFDPVTNADLAFGRIKEERFAGSRSEIEREIGTDTTDSAEGVISLEQYFPSGTALKLEAGSQMEDESFYGDSFYETRLGMTLTQALLRGYGSDVNLARLKQARLDTRISEYELRGFTESLVAQVERTYWDYALARRQIEIVEESLKVTRQQLDETQELIEVGRLAKVELAAVQAEVAAQEQALIDARAGKETIRLQLLRLFNLGGAGSWQREVELIHQPTLPDIKLEAVVMHVNVAMRMRPVLNQARLETMREDLQLVQTKNGLLPLLNLFITLGRSGYASSFGGSLADVDEEGYDALAGIRLNYPILNRDAKAQHRRALLTREQVQKALENLSQLVEVDVRSAYIQVDRAKQQIDASAVTRMFDEQKLNTETEKLRVGKSTSFLVAQAQRDLLVSRIAEIRALANYLKALVDLYQQDGSLLERRGVLAPGREQVAVKMN